MLLAAAVGLAQFGIGLVFLDFEATFAVVVGPVTIGESVPDAVGDTLEHHIVLYYPDSNKAIEIEVIRYIPSGVFSSQQHSASNELRKRGRVYS